MNKVIGYIYEEDDYSVFKRLSDNRDVLSARVNKLIASISERYICNPIIVNEKMEVIDGQGRFEARKSLGLPIHYIISEGATSDDCRRMNKYNTRWSNLDFAKSYARKGLRPYILLLRICEETGLPVSTILRLANHGSPTTAKNSDKMSWFERGELQMSELDLEKIRNIVKLSNEIIESLQFTGRVNDAFRVAAKIVIETTGYKHEKMLKNCKLYRASYNQMSRISDQLKEFERLYNKNTTNKNKIYFADCLRATRASESYDYTYSPYKDKDISTLTE